MALAEEHGFPHVRGMALVNRGWALVMLGQPAAGIPIVREGVAAVDATGARLVRSSYLALLGAADAMEGDLRSAGRRFDDALDEIERSGERVQEAGLLVAKNGLLAFSGRSDARTSEECLRRALDVARAQGAHLLELRAAIALAQHYGAGARRADARTLIAAALGAFADTHVAAPELEAAHRLLADA